MKDVLPAEILRRPKRGFGVPLDRWFRRELRDEARARLVTPTARINRILAPGIVGQLFHDHDNGRAAHGQRLWTLLMLERFLERENW